MEKIFAKPSLVRGLGNVIDLKSGSDFETQKAILTSTDEVYTIAYDGIDLNITVSRSYVPSNGTVTVTVTVTDINGDPVQGATIDLYKVIQ